jgi:pyruvate/2-oxoglutarate dehydrogenase complex dihydrolipoamide dehydrogenase (E3) component
MTIVTNQEVTEVRKGGGSGKVVTAKDRMSGQTVKVEASEVLVAAGRGPTSALMHPERAG